MDFGAVALESDFIHQLVNQEDAAPMMGIDVLAVQRVGNFDRIEAGTGIADDDQQAAFFIAGHATLYFFRRVVVAAVEDSVGQGLTERSFNLKFLASSTIQAPGHFHNALDDGTDACRVGVERDLNAYHQIRTIEPGRHLTADRRFLPTKYRQRYSDTNDSGGQEVIPKMVVLYHSCAISKLNFHHCVPPCGSGRLLIRCLELREESSIAFGSSGWRKLVGSFPA